MNSCSASSALDRSVYKPRLNDLPFMYLRTCHLLTCSLHVIPVVPDCRMVEGDVDVDVDVDVEGDGFFSPIKRTGLVDKILSSFSK